MLQSLMVYSNTNDFYSITSPILDENVAKHLMNAEPIESYIINAAAAASSPPLQDYLFAPASNNSMASAPFPSLQHQNQRQHSQYPIATSAPSSPPYPVIKSEEVARPSSMDYLVYNPTFDISPSSSPSQQPHILPSQQSPPMGPQRTMPFQDLSLMQQQQHHHQQQAQHAQQLRLQHQQRQMMYESTTASSTMSIPATTSIMTTMTTPSGGLMAPCSTVTTSVPFINATLAQDTTQPQYTFQTTYAPAAHPAAPRHKREESATHSLPRQSPPPVMMASSPSPLLAASAIPSTSSRLDKIKNSRSTRISKSGSTSSASSTTSIKKAARSSDSRESSLQPEDSPIAAAATTTSTAITSAIMTSAQTLLQPATDLSSSRAQNVTHPRRAAQNRAAQRTFRNRRKAYIKELEQRVQEVDQTRDMLESIHQENQEVWRRLQILESLASQNGLVLPAFPALTPITLSMELTKRVTLEESEQ